MKYMIMLKMYRLQHVNMCNLYISDLEFDQNFMEMSRITYVMQA